MVDREAQLSIAMMYGQGAAASKAGIDRLSKDIVDHQENRKKLSRRRMTAERYVFFPPHISRLIYLNVLLAFSSVQKEEGILYIWRVVS